MSQTLFNNCLLFYDLKKKEREPIEHRQNSSMVFGVDAYCSNVDTQNSYRSPSKSTLTCTDFKNLFYFIFRSLTGIWEFTFFQKKTVYCNKTCVTEGSDE